MKKLLIILLISLIVLSCASITREVKRKFEVCYTGRDTDIESHIDINGYYTYYDLDEQWNHIQINIMFLRDGQLMWLSDITSELYASDTCINLTQGLSFKYKNKTFVGFNCGGMYWIEGDTVKTRTLRQPSFLSSQISFSERWYKIIDRQTLQIIYSKPLLDSDVYAVNTIEEWQKNNKYSTAKFYCADSIPSSDCWLKKEKWFWCNEQDWKNYMERIKQKKKKK